MSDNDKTQMEKEILRFIYDNFPHTHKMSININDPLIERGIIDSLGLLTVIVFIEETFNIQVSDEDVELENFGTVETISSYVMRSLGHEQNG